jgi:sulfite dehydrogenase (quinone) subunit SoeC
MNPALSVIFFTTLSGAGFGLLLWLGLSIALLHANAAAMQGLYPLQMWSLLLGLALAVAGLVSSLGHLGKPGRAWRALSQWRTSWLSREGVLALATMLPALAIGALLLFVAPGPDRAMLLGMAGLVLALLALATVACTAMIYASLPPIPAWRHPLVLPVYLLFAMLAGLALLFLLMALLQPGGADARMMLGSLAVLGVLVAAAKWLYWRGIDAGALPADRAAAVGLPGRGVTVFERPHTEANYITREMAFVVARRHARALRWLATALLGGGPAAALLLAMAIGGPAVPWLAIAAFAVFAGSVVERWLFFAEARHVVTLYY